jgi:hypothetical protein
VPVLTTRLQQQQPALILAVPGVTALSAALLVAALDQVVKVVVVSPLS